MKRILSFLFISLCISCANDEVNPKQPNSNFRLNGTDWHYSDNPDSWDVYLKFFSEDSCKIGIGISATMGFYNHYSYRYIPPHILFIPQNNKLDNFEGFMINDTIKVKYVHRNEYVYFFSEIKE